MNSFAYTFCRNSIGILLITSFAILGLYSCEDETGDGMVASDFDRAALLESVATNLIVPNFESLQSSVSDMAAAAEAFVQNTTEDNLIALRTAWGQAVVDHQHCSAFGFGPAELLLGPYAEVLGVFPVNEDKVEQNLLDPDYDLANSFDRDVRGFYTVEYLIYEGASNDEIIANFDQNRKDYLLLIIDELKTTFDNIVEEWNTSYLNEFTSNDGTSAGSPISLYYNSFVKDYEVLKNFKVELPGGLTADQDGPDGTLVEAYYSGISKDLIIEHWENSKNIWFGLSRNGEELIGFEAYLEEVIGGPDLIAQTTEAISRIDNAITNLPEGRLSDNVSSETLEILRDELQANTANFKSSLSSLLGISITFNSGDGD